MKQSKLKVEYKKIADLLPYVRNARQHSESQINQIASSIKEFGFNAPIAIDTENMILCGHGRVLGAQKLGLEEVPTVCLSHLSEIEKKAYILADNRIAENSTWDTELLNIELEEIKDSDIDLISIGFDENENNLIEEDPELDLLDDFSTEYNITVCCRDLAEAENFKKMLNVDLDLTRQRLKIDFSKIKR